MDYIINPRLEVDYVINPPVEVDYIINPRLRWIICFIPIRIQITSTHIYVHVLERAEPRFKPGSWILPNTIHRTRNRETDRQTETDRHADRKTDRHADREIDRHADRETDTQTDRQACR